MFAVFRRAAIRNGVQAFYERDKKQRIRLPQFNESYVKSAKKQRFQKLCDRAALGEVWISDSCPESFWKGDGVGRPKEWIPRRGGESSLKWDDDADSFSRSTDSKLQKFAPQPAENKPEVVYAMDPFGRNRAPEAQRGPTITRYV